MKKLLALSMIVSLIGGMAMAEKQGQPIGGPGDRTRCGGIACVPTVPPAPGDSGFGRAGGSGLLGTDGQAVEFGEFLDSHGHETTP